MQSKQRTWVNKHLHSLAARSGKKVSWNTSTIGIRARWGKFWVHCFFNWNRIRPLRALHQSGFHLAQLDLRPTVYALYVHHLAEPQSFLPLDHVILIKNYSKPINSQSLNAIPVASRPSRSERKRWWTEKEVFAQRYSQNSLSYVQTRGCWKLCSTFAAYRCFTFRSYDMTPSDIRSCSSSLSRSKTKYTGIFRGAQKCDKLA